MLIFGEAQPSKRIAAVSLLGSNSRVRGKTAVALGWLPSRRSVTHWIVNES